MRVAREYHAAAALGSARVLVCGGINTITADPVYHDSCDVYDGATNSFLTAAPTLPGKRTFLSMVATSSGRVYALGGHLNVPEDYRAEVWRSDGAGEWQAQGSLRTARTQPEAAWLPTAGVVLVTGGFAGQVSAEDEFAVPAANGTIASWTEVAAGSRRIAHSLTVLPSGSEALVVGGVDPRGAVPYLRTARRFVASGNSGSFTELTGLPTALASHTATWVSETSAVLLAGGQHDQLNRTKDASLYRLANNGSVEPVAPMLTGRANHTAVYFRGVVIVAGGEREDYSITNQVEFYDPSKNRWFALEPMRVARRDQIMTVLDDRRILIAGGSVPGGAAGGIATDTAEVLTPRLQGEPCDDTKHECLTGQCVDGVCCDSACTGNCQRCDAAGSCKTDVTGPPLGDRSCADGFVCASGACLTRCSNSAQCAEDYYCQGNRCLERKPQGSDCREDRDCADGRCVDGFCCESACTERCEACGEPGSEGKCVPVAGSPRGDRQSCGEPSGDCGLACDGADAEACHFLSRGSQCGEKRCTNGVEQHVAKCDGNGQCLDTPKQCGAFACEEGSGFCRSDCENDTHCLDNGYACVLEAQPSICVPKPDLGKDCDRDGDCADGLVCENQVCCGKRCDDESWSCALPGHRGQCRKVQGASCETDFECGSEQCVDGVCCAEQCSGQCESCNTPEHAGECRPVRGAPAVGRERCESSDEFCAQRECDGEDAAEHRAACLGLVNVGASCAEASCKDTQFTPERYCSAEGACRGARTQDCSSYVCGSSGCLDGCEDDDACSDGNACIDGLCKPRKAHCDGDMLVPLSGAPKSCGAYRCLVDRCAEPCASSQQCADGYVCDAGQCVDGSTNATATAGCRCSLPGADRLQLDGPWYLAALLAATLSSRARARRRRASAAPTTS